MLSYLNAFVVVIRGMTVPRQQYLFSTHENIESNLIAGHVLKVPHLSLSSFEHFVSQFSLLNTSNSTFIVTSNSTFILPIVRIVRFQYTVSIIKIDWLLLFDVKIRYT